jgi:inosine-uridine nucleoside N-ribohydrolase
LLTRLESQAIALALNNPKDLDVLLLTSTHGNIHVEAVTKNLVALMNVMKNENEARARLGLPVPPWRKPTISIGSNKPIVKEHGHGEIPPEDGLEGYHGVDGLNGLHARASSNVSHPTVHH